MSTALDLSDPFQVSIVFRLNPTVRSTRNETSGYPVPGVEGGDRG